VTWRTPRGPDLIHREAEAFERLLLGVEKGKVLVPDETARAAVAAAALGVAACAAHRRSAL
jgi:hypothetical protein